MFHATRLASTLVALAALCSGAASLALEVVWSKALVVPLGNSSDATAIVLGGFMLGIAGGAKLGAKLARGANRSLCLYAALELLLAVFALFVPWLLVWLTSWTLPQPLIAIPGMAFGLRLAVSLCLIAVPCLVMGATLPLLLTMPNLTLSRGRSIAILYGVNTLGATVSSALTGFYGIATWGISGCSRGAALCSVLAALLAVSVRLLTRTSGDDERFEQADIQSRVVEPARDVRTDISSRSVGPSTDDSPYRATGERVERRDRRLALSSTFVSGFALLSAEVFWARILTFVFGHDTYAFATLLSVVLLGLAVGGLVYSLLEKYPPRQVAGWSLASMAGSLLVSFYVAGGMLVRLGRDPFGIGDNFIGNSALSAEMLREFAYTPILALLPCLCSGVAYPAAVALYAGRCGTASNATGAVGLANGVGATLGASLTALVLVGWFGIQGVLSSMALLTASLATALLLRGELGRARRILPALPLGLTIASVLLAPKDLPRRMLLASVGPRHQTLLFYEEARTATVSVIRNSIHGERQLLVNAVNEVTTRLVHDQSFKLLGQLGPLLHPNPRHAVMICLGAGLAAGSALTHPLERLDVVDLLEAVRRGARHFPEENNHVLDDPRLKLHVDDGRQFLLTTSERYDLAIVDSTHPKSVDSWILYTREFFQLLRSRLSPDGIAVQWLPLHGLSEREFIAVVATFAAEFPQMTLWASVGYETYGQVGYAKLVGQNSKAPMRVDIARMRHRLARPSVQRDLARYGMGELPEILDQFIAGPERLRNWISASPILTDDRPFLAYLTPLAAGRPMTPDRLLAVRESVLPYLTDATADAATFREETHRYFEAQGLVVAGQLEGASRYHRRGEKIRHYVEQTKTTLPYYEAIAKRYPDDAERLFEAGTQLAGMGYGHEGETALLAGLRLRPDSLRLGLNAALVTLSRGAPQRAAEMLSALLSRHPNSAILHHNLGVALLELGEPGAARRSFLTASALDPECVSTRLTLAETESRLGNLSGAAAILERLIAEEPLHDAAIELLARVKEQLGANDAAIELFAQAARLNPYNERYALEWGARLVVTRPRQAAGILEREESLHPENAKIRQVLGNAWLRLERWQDASLQFVSALEQDPRAGEAAFGLGVSMSRLGRRSEAKDALCLAHKLGAARPQLLVEMAAIGEKLEGCGASSVAP